MAEVQIGAADAFLRLVSDDSDGVVETVVAELHSDGISARQTVVHSYSAGFCDLVSFFDGLVTDWRGWTGIRTWASLEDDLTITAAHRYRHVPLQITLRRDGPGWGNDGWLGRCSITIDPGEQLSQIATDLASMMTRL